MSSSKPERTGNGLRSIKTTNIFRLINFELYTKPNTVVMGAGLACFAGALGYLIYMRSKYNNESYDALKYNSKISKADWAK